MRAIKNSIFPPLNDEEKRLFEHMHECQPYYGDLPAALLAERMSFLRQAVLAIWDEPHNPQHVGVLHRLLACYAEMAATRRQADRESKKRRQLLPPESPQGQESVKAEDADVCADGSDSEDLWRDRGPYRGGRGRVLGSGAGPGIRIDPF